jgi:hypothetical protein
VTKRINLNKIVSPAGVDVGNDVFGKICELREEVEISNNKLDVIILAMERLAAAAEKGIEKSVEALESAEQTRKAIEDVAKKLEVSFDGTTGGEMWWRVVRAQWKRLEG